MEQHTGATTTGTIRAAVFLKWICLALIEAYRMCISPLLGPACRFHPTCSAYAREAIDRYGVCRGIVLAASRLLKCHPFHPGGVDPVR